MAAPFLPFLLRKASLNRQGIRSPLHAPVGFWWHQALRFFFIRWSVLIAYKRRKQEASSQHILLSFFRSAPLSYFYFFSLQCNSLFRHHVGEERTVAVLLHLCFFNWTAPFLFSAALHLFNLFSLQRTLTSLFPFAAAQSDQQQAEKGEQPSPAHLSQLIPAHRPRLLFSFSSTQKASLLFAAAQSEAQLHLFYFLFWFSVTHVSILIGLH